MTRAAAPTLQLTSTDRFAGAAAPAANFVRDRSVYVADVPAYELHRSMLYALGARSVSNKMLAHVEVVVHGGAKPPAKAKAKYPTGEFVAARAVVPLFHQEVGSFEAYIRALQGHGFTVRNPSDEGDATFEFFALPLQGRSLPATLLHWLGTSEFIGRFVRPRHFPVDQRDDEYVEFPVARAGGVAWYYVWRTDAWRRVSAQRGEGDYPLEIKGEGLLAVLPLLWTATTGLYFFEYPHVDSISGLFVQAGIDARTGLCHGAAISRVWT